MWKRHSRYEPDAWVETEETETRSPGFLCHPNLHSRAGMDLEILTDDSAGLGQRLSHDVAKTSGVEFSDSADHAISDLLWPEHLRAQVAAVRVQPAGPLGAANKCRKQIRVSICAPRSRGKGRLSSLWVSIPDIGRLITHTPDNKWRPIRDTNELNRDELT
jgi:hypothetical protein